MYLYFVSPVGIYNGIENSPASLAVTSIFSGSNDFKFDSEIRFTVLQPALKFKEIDRNLHVIILMKSYQNHEYIFLYILNRVSQKVTHFDLREILGLGNKF